jgi:hypothetical protein
VAFGQYFHLFTGKPDQYQGVKKINDFDTDAEDHNSFFSPVREYFLERSRRVSSPPLPWLLAVNL